MNVVNDQIETAVPTRLEMLTPGLLSSILRADVRSVDILQSNIGYGMTGSIARIALEYGRENPGLPRTMVAKFSAFEDRTRQECDALGFYEREVYFYRDMAARTNVRTPVCYYAAYDAGQSRSLLLLEDLSDHRMERSSDGCSIEQAQQAIQAMARMHAAWWNHPELEDNPWFFRQPGKFGDLFAVMWDDFCEGMQFKDPAEIQRVGEIVLLGIHTAEKHLAQAPLTLIHNDFQLDNLTFGPRNGPQEVVLLDWGIYTAARGPADLAYLLTGSLGIEARRAVEAALMKEYVDALASAGVEGYTLEQCLEDYKNALLIYFTRAVVAICTIEMTDGPEGKRVNPRAAANFMPVLRRYQAAILDHYAPA